MAHIISAPRLAQFIKSAFIATGFANEDAEITADLMTQADISGQDGHGIFRLPQYIKRLQEGAMNPKPQLKYSHREQPLPLLMVITELVI